MRNFKFVILAIASLLLGACASTNSGKRDDPVYFGGAGGGNAGAGATTGMSLSF